VGDGLTVRLGLGDGLPWVAAAIALDSVEVAAAVLVALAASLPAGAGEAWAALAAGAVAVP
jgi:hypothetical protein